MLLLVLRLLAVYFGTAALCLWLAHRFVSRLRLRVAVLLALGPFLLVGKALVTAGVHAPIDIPYQAPPLSILGKEMGTSVTRTPVLGDIVYQEIPWRKAVREAFKKGRLPLWNRFVLAGEPLLAVQQPVVFYPATWIGFLLPLAQAWTFEMAMRFLLALLCAYLFLRELECGEIAALIGAVGWAFSDYLVFYLGYPLNPAVAPLPLLLLGLHRLARGGGKSVVALITVSLLLILTAGHPETLLHCFAGAGIYFLFELGFAGKGKRLRPVLLSLLAGVLALGLTAVLLLPLAEALPHTQEHFYRASYYAHARRSMPLGDSIVRALPNAMPVYFGVAGEEPASYCGSLLWPLAAVGLFSRRREKWAILVMGVLGVAIGARLRGPMDAICALPLFNIGLNERMVFLGALAISTLAALGVERLREKREIRLFAAAALLGIVTVAVLVAIRGNPRFPTLPISHARFRYFALVQIVPLLLCFLPWLTRGRILERTGISLLLLLLIVQRGMEEGGIYPTYSSRAFYPGMRSLQSIPRTVPYRMTAVGFTFVPNIAALYELEDIRGYEAMTFRPLFQTYPLWCVHQPVWFNRVDDPTKPFLSFLNVRYFFAAPSHVPPPGWRILHSSAEGVVFENPSPLPRAFVPRSVRFEADGSERLWLLGGIQDFSKQGILGETRPANASRDDWQGNGDASVDIASYEPQRMVLAIHAREAAVVGTSVVAWPGWKLSVDGKDSPLLSYNHAFLGFRVPAGNHEAVLRYLPDSFLAGSAISLTAFGASLVLLLRRRRTV